MSEPARVSLCCLPTPLHRLPRLSAELGVDLWVKRDDLTGFAFGGNKGRKLEYIIADIVASGAEVVVTCGSTQSNFVRQLGAACAVHDIACHAVVMDLPRPDGAAPVGKGDGTGGNVVLDELFGVTLHRIPDGGWTELEEAAAGLAGQIRAEGKRTRLVPLGGSGPLGALAFWRAAHEVQTQFEGVFDAVVTASSSGSTQTGLACAFHGTRTRVIGVSADPEPEIADDLSRLSHELAAVQPRCPALAPHEFDFRLDWVGPGYGLPSEEGQAAMERMARAEGIALDPVYSAKACAGLFAMVSSGELKGSVCLWHTGGTPALFATP
ncbi:MAG: pyridoxal-phosphate dependent enzyme [Fimbriimonadaceae bacterium]|nr:pyridoxal-phosphate dependent enzyme [Fimbriimonadaceae bacterium]